MARIDIKSAGATLSDGVLQLENGVAMDATLRKVADQNNTTSPLKLSTALVQTTSTLKITTADNPYIDAEDNSGNNRFTIGRDPASQIVNVDFASNPTGSTSQVGAIRTYQDGVNLSDVVKFREDGQVTFTERVNVEADSLVTTQSSSVIAASTTNASLVIVPNGTGGLIASIPDGTATGGNARGARAVDLQLSRYNAVQVASGADSFIGGGANSRATAQYSVVAGGNQGFAVGYGSFVGSGFNNTVVGTESSVVGGNTNTCNGSYSLIGGGANNTASSNYSTVSGGQNNTASTGTHATVVGGTTNTASGANSVVGGSNSVASGTSSTAFGRNSTASNTGSVAIGYWAKANGYGSVALGGEFSIGNQTLSGSTYGFACGGQSQSYLYSQFTNSGSMFVAQGDAQQSLLTARREAALTTGATTVLS